MLGWLVLAIAVVVSGLAGGLYLYGHETLAAIAPHTKQVIALGQGPEDGAGAVRARDRA